jgi:hypothetical protein
MPPESSPEALPSSPPPEDAPPSLPPLPLLHAPLSGEKHVELLVSQQQGVNPWQPPVQFESFEQLPAAPVMSFPLLLPVPPLELPDPMGGGVKT